MRISWAYRIGCITALEKIGAAGTITYAARHDRNSFNHGDNDQQDLWAEFDRRSAGSGEESGIGMPTAGGIPKAASEGYSSHQGVYGQGSSDANSAKPDNDLRQQSAIDEAFASNEDYDESYASEPPLTQPHGSKYANNGFAGIKAMGAQGLRPKPPGSVSNPIKPGKALDPRTDKPEGMNLQHGIQAATNAADVAKSFTSPEQRLMGSPL